MSDDSVWFFPPYAIHRGIRDYVVTCEHPYRIIGRTATLQAAKRLCLIDETPFTQTHSSESLPAKAHRKGNRAVVSHDRPDSPKEAPQTSLFAETEEVGLRTRGVRQ